MEVEGREGEAHHSVVWGALDAKPRIYYNSLIDTLLSRGIKPFMTISQKISHYDIPEEHQQRYKGVQIWPILRERFEWKKTQGGRIGVAMNTKWFEPINNSLEDKKVAERAQSFYMNWS
ncbi:beta-glucosidase 46-like [Vigna radiata var. radiata]|uniref:Beta-glucosidase 46-like n=1 Tax=Vigna radiata var. radiata TaxID=3916 RepID=A0A3Q0FCB8_VIGRR|nr:beta-glucosidase 46-like [Vigna radiata var. radiata]